VAGYERDAVGIPIAKLWKNGAPTVLAENAVAQAVFVTTKQVIRGN
jgi:hypothetical protein